MVVLFDFDGVLTLEASGTGAQAAVLSEKYKWEYQKTKVALQKLTNESNIGQLPYGTSIALFRDEMSAPEVSVQDLLDASQPKINPQVFEISKRIRESNHRIGIFTNQPPERWRTINSLLQLENDFDHLFVSGLMGAKKSDITRKAYEIVEESLRVDPKDILFIDNKEKNLLIPNQRGWNTYFFNFEDNDVEALTNHIKKSLN